MYRLSITVIIVLRVQVDATQPNKLKIYVCYVAVVFVDPNLITFLHSFDIVAKQHVSVSASVACVCV